MRGGVRRTESSEPDARMFHRICPRVPVRVIKNGVDPAYFSPEETEPEEPVLVFEGNMSFPPNVDAVVYFARQVLPRIREEVPEARFRVVGKDPVPEVRALEGPGVEVTGFVEDVRPYIRQGHWRHCEMELHHSAWFAQALCELLAAGK